ncbi:hypothetical protein RFI_20027 [Reticulomyxa filosa]|uniref:Uncharacterized protein n=1 Tax=Reticulomyxa filosa TaxID=46433 RepID=X6MV14_RETFI|nr:hypothetical protein RFI_20027 [Reticulomyxa filosa]|eukprot:ETO17302.1 hypothetical protein RFI_20027 [Reticulomyxa filosa]
MQATLKNFTTLEGYTAIENPKLSHSLYEYIRAWKPSNSKEEELKLYITLQANSYPPMDDDNQKHETFDCLQCVIAFLEREKKMNTKKILFCRYLEEVLWDNYILDSKQHIPVCISLAKNYNKQNEKDIILHALQEKHISKETMNAIRENDYDKYFYDRFNLDRWKAKVITYRSNVLSDNDINTTLIGVPQNYISMIYLWPFTKQQMDNYIEKFAKIKTKKNISMRMIITGHQNNTRKH